jgi:hypothetical protein
VVNATTRLSTGSDFITDQLKGKLQGKTAWTKRSKQSGRFMDVKKSAKKFRGVRREKVA